MEKRGQVTVFIILGIVILALIGGVYAVRSGFLDVYLDSQRNRVLVPEEIVPVQQYLENCLEDNVVNGLNYLSSQGGYLELDTYRAVSGDTLTNTLQVYPGLRVAYWYYENLDGDGINQMPSESLMEKQLNTFVEIGFRDCIEGLDAFEGEGYSISVKDLIKPDIKIEKRFVDAVVRIPVEVKIKGVGSKINRHVVKYNTRFGDLYEKAKDLFEDDNENLWLENKTLSYIYTYTEDLPHYSTEFTCSPLIWEKSEIEDNYKKILELNVPYYVVAGSNVDSYYEDENSLNWNVNGFEDYEVYFEYDRNWPFEFDVRPNDGEVLVSKPFPGGIPLIGFCTNTYNFFYYVKHPVLITVSDGEEEFSFAQQIVIRKNKIREPVDLDEIDYIQYCDLRDADVSIEVNYDDYGLYKPLDNASLFYKCMNHYCYLGDTDSYGMYEGTAPSCYGGILEVRKEGYKKTEADFDTFGGVSEIFIPVGKYSSLDYRFMVYDLVGGSLVGPRELTASESVLFQIDEVGIDTLEGSFIGFYPDEETSFDISPGNYLVTAKLVNKGGAHIESKEISQCKCPGFTVFCLCGEETVTLDPIDIEEVVSGGATISWVVGNEISDKNKVVFYIINRGVPTTYDDLKETYDSESVSLGYESSLVPSLENE